LAFHELSSEKEALADELEEAETRAKHLKMQLHDLAGSVTQHDKEMNALRNELEQEKEERRQEKEAREKSIALIRAQPTSPISPPEVQRRTSEDLGVDTDAARRHRRLRSRTSDTSFESDDESRTGDSVFSRCMSPVMQGISTNETTPEVGQARWESVKVVNIPTSAPFAARPKPVQQRSTFSKILKGISTANMSASMSSDSTIVEAEDLTGEQEEGCKNCRGGSSAVAWDTVGLMRAENRGLKQRVGELEESVEGALDLVRTLGLV
jgi:hypothetical protein